MAQPVDTPVRRLALVLAFLLAAPAPVPACAVATQMTLHNATSQVLTAFYIDDTEDVPPRPSTANRLPREGLAPGATATITFPSCMGIYVLRGVFADGTERRHERIDARRIRSMTLR
jgi:hypothetical protein